MLLFSSVGVLFVCGFLVWGLGFGLFSLFVFCLDLFCYVSMRDEKETDPLTNTEPAVYIYYMETLLLCSYILTFSVLNSQCSLNN